VSRGLVFLYKTQSPAPAEVRSEVAAQVAELKERGVAVRLWAGAGCVGAHARERQGCAGVSCTFDESCRAPYRADVARGKPQPHRETSIRDECAVVGHRPPCPPTSGDAGRGRLRRARSEKSGQPDASEGCVQGDTPSYTRHAHQIWRHVLSRVT
jgi:hypothetical protein